MLRQKSAWNNAELYSAFLRDAIAVVREVSPHGRIVILFDCASIHLTPPSLAQFASGSNIYPIPIPAGCTNTLQPLDVRVPCLERARARASRDRRAERASASRAYATRRSALRPSVVYVSQVFGPFKQALKREACVASSIWQALAATIGKQLYARQHAAAFRACGFGGVAVLATAAALPPTEEEVLSVLPRGTGAGVARALLAPFRQPLPPATKAETRTGRKRSPKPLRLGRTRAETRALSGL